MSDPIDRQAAIDEFESIYPANAWLDYAVSIIKKLPSAQSKPRWIPVTEDKPRKCSHSHVLVTDFDMVGEAYYNSDGHWFDLRGNKLKAVTAWMPLPEPYKEEIKNG